MSDHNDNDGNDFVNDVLNAKDEDDNEDNDQDDVDVPYGIDDDDDNVDVHDDDACHNTCGLTLTFENGTYSKKKIMDGSNGFFTPFLYYLMRYRTPKKFHILSFHLM